MNVKRNISMMATAIAALVILWSALPAASGPGACVVRGDGRVPMLFEKLGLPEGRQ
jgi:hypothetical protein